MSAQDAARRDRRLQSNAQSARGPNAMHVGALHMIAQREWQGGNQNVDGRVMRTSFTVFYVKKLGQERFRRNAQERGVVVSLKRICQAVRSMVSCTKGHVEKFLMNDDADD